MKTRKGSSLLLVELIIIVVIAACMVFLNIFMTQKISELQQSAQDAVFVMEDVNYPAESALMEDIQEYIPSAYKMIEIYDEDFNQLIQLQFSPDITPPDSIQSNQDLMQLLSSAEEGQTSYVLDGIEQNVFFRWITNANNESRLMIIYSAVTDVENLWVFSLVSYTVIILAFVLLILSQFKVQKVNASKYKNTVKLS